MVFPSGHVYDTPCVPNLVKYLALNGCEVDLFAARNTATPDGCLQHERVTVHRYPIELVDARENVATLSFGFGLWLAPRLWRGSYDLVIACGIRGLFVVGVLAPFLGLRYGYNSLELYSGASYERGSRGWFKRLERWFNQRAGFSIIQDEQRAELLREINALKDQFIGLFPNAPYQSQRPLGVDRKRLREQFGIRDTATLVIYSGSLQAPWSGVRKIVAAVARFDNDHVLFLQARAATSADLGPGVEQLCNNGRLVVSNMPLSVETYDSLVQASDIGLAWYESDDENIRYAGLSSGKVAHYLRWGKPIIINRLPLFEDFIPEYHCGLVVDDATEIAAALNTISANYEYYAEGARTAYSELFDMDSYARNLVQRVEDIVRLEP